MMSPLLAIMTWGLLSAASSNAVAAFCSSRGYVLQTDSNKLITVSSVHDCFGIFSKHTEVPYFDCKTADEAARFARIYSKKTGKMIYLVGTRWHLATIDNQRHVFTENFVAGVPAFFYDLAKFDQEAEKEMKVAKKLSRISGKSLVCEKEDIKFDFSENSEVLQYLSDFFPSEKQFKNTILKFHRCN